MEKRPKAAKLFEIEMQRTCTNVTKTNSYICQLLFADLKSRAIPSAKTSMLNAEFHSQCCLARASLSLCNNNIFEFIYRSNLPVSKTCHFSISVCVRCC